MTAPRCDRRPGCSESGCPFWPGLCYNAPRDAKSVNTDEGEVNEMDAKQGYIEGERDVEGLTPDGHITPAASRRIWEARDDMAEALDELTGIDGREAEALATAMLLVIQRNAAPVGPQEPLRDYVRGSISEHRRQAIRDRITVSPER